MSRRQSAAPSAGQGPPPVAPAYPSQPPPAQSSWDAASAAVTSEPVPKPQPRNSRAQLEQATQWLPGFLRPFGMLLLGMARAAWTVAVPIAVIAYRIGVWASPVLVWVFWKWVKWYLLGFVTKASRALRWGLWILSWFTRSGGGAAAA